MREGKEGTRMSIELKPCPFCGAAPEVTERSGVVKVFCRYKYCLVRVETIGENLADCAEVWNERKGENEVVCMQ